MLNKLYWCTMGIFGFFLVVFLIWWLVTLAGSSTPVWTSWSILCGLLTLCSVWLIYSLIKDLRQKDFLTFLKVFLIALCCFLMGFFQDAGLSFIHLYDFLPKNEYLINCLHFFIPFVLAFLLACVANKLFGKEYPPCSIIKMTALITIVNNLWTFYFKWHLILFTYRTFELP